MDQVKWRLEVTIHGYRAFGLIDGGGGSNELQASFERVTALFDRLSASLTGAGHTEIIVRGRFDCENLPNSPFTVGGRELTSPARYMTGRIFGDDLKCKCSVYGRDDLIYWKSVGPIFQTASIVFDMDNFCDGFTSQEHAQAESVCVDRFIYMLY